MNNDALTTLPADSQAIDGDPRANGAGHESDDADLASLVPEPGAGPEQFAAAQETLQEADPTQLRMTLSEIRWRLSQLEQAASEEWDALVALQEAIQGVIDRRRLQVERAAISDDEERRPLRRRLMDLLWESEAAPSELVGRADAETASVSRALATLKKEGLVREHRDHRDGRRRIYGLTALGFRTLERHWAHGQRPQAPDPPGRETLPFLWRSLGRAVAARRFENQLSEAERRLRAIVAEAERLRSGDLAVQARRELLTTLRQQEDEQGFAIERAALNEIAGGSVASLGGSCILPANGELEYELGRLPEGLGGGQVLDRARHLVTALTIFSRLSFDPDREDRLSYWREREAWALVSLADNHRERSLFEDAVHLVSAALKGFKSLDDTYGSSRCEFLLGFCLRLQGNFSLAGEVLARAYEASCKYGFARFHADTLAQIGDVKRSLGQLDEARECLIEAVERAQYLVMPVTAGFANSALGATEFALGLEVEALGRFAKAQELLAARRHEQGLALNTRRQGVAYRVSGKSGHARAERCIAEATRRYTQLKSPAGVAASRVELGRLMIDRGRDPEPASRHLMESLGEDEQRVLLKKDPWLPGMLRTFAGLSGDELLRAAAQKLVAARSEEDPNAASDGVEPVAEDVAAAVEEMASEPICQLDSPLPIPA